ncbi:MAG: hypothetical protein LBV26_06825 [Bacteroidales bacterium]|jgi:hypothetical protein|nr:hypothetical protein [Bacteroidales bacterium]
MMKIIYNNFLPLPGFYAMVFFGVILARKKYRPLPERTLNHEAIHAAQAAECGGWILFYLRYLWLWIQYGYGNNPFEREAYEYAGYGSYLLSRISFAWKKYIK